MSNTYKIDTTQPVLVTGATGYVAGWLVKKLLGAGVTVHAAVRDPENKAKIGHLTAMADAAPGTIKLFKADLLDHGSYKDAMAGCSIVFHTASPFTTRVKNPQKELIEPAQLGTRNVLEEANRTDSVKRVVLTSSCAAIYTDAADCADAPGGMLTEDVWNKTASLDYQPYSYSKTLAEQEAWKIAEGQDQWKLVVVNPCLVIGPSVNARPTSESFNIVKQLGDGTAKAGVPNVGLGVIDVRDLADAHIAAAYVEGAHGRNIIAAHATSLLEIGLTLRETFGKEYPLPSRALPKWLVWLIGPLVGLSRKFVRRSVNIAWRADNSKAVRELGLTYRPMKDSMTEMFRQMIDAGYFKKA